MTSEVQAAERNQLSGQQAPERRARFWPGIRMLVLGLGVLIVGAALLWLARRFSGDAATALVWLGALVLVAGVLLLRGLTAVIEMRLTRLSYAPEIAQAMLRQQVVNTGSLYQ